MKFFKNTDGQTLVEVVVAVAVIGLVLTGIVLAVTSGLKTSRISRERFEARRIAESQLEDIRSERNNDPGSFFVSENAGDTIEVGPEVVEGNLTSYQMTTTYDYAVDGKEVEITVEVEWGGEESFTVSQTTTLTLWQ